jgi:hypothetical protein
MNIIKHKYGKRTVSLLLAVILVLCPLQVRAADNKPTIEIGDYIQMGTYGGEPIVWRCVAKDSNGPLMLSDRVLCDYMPYDAKTNKNAETGSHRRNSWRDNFGSNHWRDSNIRSWLNSNAEAGFAEIRQQRILSILKRQHMTKRRASFAAFVRMSWERFER